MAKQIPLTIDPNIVPNWGLWEAYREILQGAIDADVEYTVEYNAIFEKLTVSNPGQLTKESLLIGHSTKRGDSTKIGQHGEGYKLAAAVLLRSGKPFRIYNNKEIWDFNVKNNRKFNANLIHLTITSWFVEQTDTILWEIGNISQEEYRDLMAKVQDKGDIAVDLGYILLDQPGQIYSGDLFVCHKKELTFGYNFKPGVLELQRDRNLISDFDIYWETSKMWLGQPDLVTHIRDGIADTKYATAAEATANQAYTLFKSEHGDNAVPCASEGDKITGADNIIVPQVYRDTITKSKEYRTNLAAKAEDLNLSPFEQLYQWYEGFKNEYGFTDKDFEVLLERAKQWYIK